jgi:hypothetical protein
MLAVIFGGIDASDDVFSSNSNVIGNHGAEFTQIGSSRMIDCSIDIRSRLFSIARFIVIGGSLESVRRSPQSASCRLQVTPPV